MLEVAAPLLSPGVKGFFETSAFLIGTPLLILGGIGVLIALTPFEIRWPLRQPAEGMGEAQEAQEAQEDVSVEGHPGPATYVRVGIILAVVTTVEVVLYYLDIAYGALLGLLLALSLMKFLLVVLWFMHLQFDSRLFSTLFAGGMMLVIALFFVVLATLGASLV